MKVALAIAAGLVVAGLAASAALAQDRSYRRQAWNPAPSGRPLTRRRRSSDIAFYVETLTGER